MELNSQKKEMRINKRQGEIIKACDLLYSTLEYEDINLKAISEITTFSRPTIYNYYHTKEEILLDLLKQEYLSWNSELCEYFDQYTHLTQEEYCNFLSISLSAREKLMKLLSFHYTIIEKNCSLEKLIVFKKEIQPVFVTIRESVIKYFKGSSEEDIDNFSFLFISMIHGLYPLTHLTSNQMAAMNAIHVQYSVPDFKEKCYKGLLLLTSKLRQ
jgi:AcrR family transcriptional regulator